MPHGTRGIMMHHQTESLSGPINNLPFELLSRILEMGAAERRREDENNHYLLGSPDHIPCSPPFQIVVSHVCRYWRNVAFRTPRLWTSIFFHRLAHPHPKLVSLLMERSNPLPIDIHINPRKTWIFDDPLQFPYNLILPHVSRWRSLRVTFQRKDHELSFLDSLSHPCLSVPSKLEMVALRVEDHRFSPSTSKRFTLFNGSAPRLTTIILWGVLVDWGQPWISSAVNLTTLELGYHKEHNRPSWAQFSAALCGAPALKRLVLCSSGPSGMPTEWVTRSTNGNPSSTDLNSPIPLTNLREFLLALDRPTRAIGFLRRFYMPALKCLSLDLRDADYTNFVRELAGPAISLTPLTAGERRPRSLLSDLEELNIFDLPCHPDAQRLLCQELQSVKTLRIPMIRRSIYPCQFVALLLPCPQLEAEQGRGEQCVTLSLPCLEDLTVFFDRYNYTLVREVVRERKNAGCPLTSLSFGQAFGLSDELKKWFTQNLETFNPISPITRCDHDPWKRMFRGERE